MAEKKSMFYVAIFVLMILSISLVDASSTPSSEMRELGNINIAMWHGRYANPLTNVNLANGAVLAVKAMFEWMGCTVSYVNTLDFLLGLEGYDVLLVPGYPTNALLNQLTIDHINNINDFVAQGGIFIGICGGAALGCTNIDKGPTSHPGILNGTTEMDLFTGLAVAPIYDYDSPCMITLNVNTSSLGPDLSGMNSSYTILYNYGPYFHIDDWTGIHILARYSINNNPAIISLQKDRGCVLLIGPHP
ncbi:MAG: hypothetical protein KAU48_07570, partial [Candidatus Thorarchaeota archaeon]|nr:hypothetical protein [Candidatus Thorarchaeota archaeon]